MRHYTVRQQAGATVPLLGPFPQAIVSELKRLLVRPTGLPVDRQRVIYGWVGVQDLCREQCPAKPRAFRGCRHFVGGPRAQQGRQLGTCASVQAALGRALAGASCALVRRLPAAAGSHLFPLMKRASSPPPSPTPQRPSAGRRAGAVGGGGERRAHAAPGGARPRAAGAPLRQTNNNGNRPGTFPWLLRVAVAPELVWD